MTATGGRDVDPGPFAPARRRVIGSDVDACTAGQMSERILAWARHGESRYVCYANAHMLVLAGDHPEGLPVGFYGSTDEALEAMAARARAEFPGIRIAYLHSPPFRPVTPAETAAIAASGARLLFVGLGCPKQECWMAAHRRRVPAVMHGVGAAFDQYSGRVPACPRAFSVLALEWACRSLREPRRLLWRNLRSTTLFALRAAGQLLGGGRGRARA